MKNSIFKTIAMGAIFGATLFFMPMFIIGMFICFCIFGFFMRRRMSHMHYGHYQFAFADKIRNMNDEEYQSFKEKMSKSNCYGKHYNQQQVNN